MRKVIVIGCSGSGKSVFSRKLSERIGLPLYHLDMIWHKPDKTNVTREEFDLTLRNIMNREDWIIDGNYNRTLPCRLAECDTVFLFDLPVELCLDGARSRIGKQRDDLPWLETELDEEFKAWIEEFPTVSLPKIYSLLEEHKDGKNIVVFKSREEADEYISRLPIKL